MNDKVFDLIAWTKTTPMFDTNELESKIDHFEESIDGMRKTHHLNMKTWSQATDLIGHIGSE